MSQSRLKLRELSTHVLVLSILVLYNNCAGFTPQELESITASSVAVPNPTPNPNAQRTKVFVMQGRLARTAMSCDGGMTWINDQSHDDNLRCWLSDPKDPRNVECDHNPYAGVGVDSGDGWIFANFGWGYPGSVRRSLDGIHWEILKSDGVGGGVVYALGKLFLDWGGGWLSSDQGNTWSSVSSVPSSVTEDHPLAFRLGTKFALVGRLNGIGFSTDQGQTWRVTPYLGYQPRNIVEGNGRIVTIGVVNKTPPEANQLWAASSSDTGLSWTNKQIHALENTEWSQLVFNGTDFVAWSRDMKVWKSKDGITWTSQTVVINGPTYSGAASWVAQGPVGYNSQTQTYAMVSGEWSYWYEKQRAYVSSDGVNWAELDASHFKGGHPIGMITTAEIESKYCP